MQCLFVILVSGNTVLRSQKSQVRGAVVSFALSWGQAWVQPSTTAQQCSRRAQSRSCCWLIVGAAISNVSTHVLILSFWQRSVLPLDTHLYTEISFWRLGVGTCVSGLLVSLLPIEGLPSPILRWTETLVCVIGRARVLYCTAKHWGSAKQSIIQHAFI